MDRNQFIDIQAFIKDLIGDGVKIYSFEFTNQQEWKTHTLKRYGYCDELIVKRIIHLIKHMANMNVSVATYNEDTNTGIVLDRRENIR